MLSPITIIKQQSVSVSVTSSVRRKNTKHQIKNETVPSTFVCRRINCGHPLLSIIIWCSRWWSIRSCGRTWFVQPSWICKCELFYFLGNVISNSAIIWYIVFTFSTERCGMLMTTENIIRLCAGKRCVTAVAADTVVPHMVFHEADQFSSKDSRRMRFLLIR